MKLSDLICDLSQYVFIGEDVDVDSLSHSSTTCENGALYFAINGREHNGNDYICDAIENGAVAVVTDNKVQIDIPQIIVNNVREAMGFISKKFYHDVCDNLNIIGIVGTNGKTTSSYIIKNILETWGCNTGVIGTNGVYIGDKYIDEELTTPDPINLHKYFNEMVSAGIKYCIMEVSAHAIDLSKIAGVKFRIGLFTNISNEHLDYFGDMENYSKCKLKFFDKLYIDEAVVNVDDDYGIMIARENKVPCATYGIYNPSNVFAINMYMNLDESGFVINVLDDILNIKTKLIGEYNVYNILGAVSVCKLLGVDNESIQSGVNCIQNIAGRCNIIKYKNNHIMIDFAHTPDGFEKVLSTLKPLVKGKLVALFGCVGYSDSKKRALMGMVASKYSDFIILTSDNPNYVCVADINRDIKSGFKKYSSFIEIDDRVAAIKSGIGMLCQDDMLVILGKGGERKQVVQGNSIEYNEVEIVNNLIN